MITASFYIKHCFSTIHPGIEPSVCIDNVQKKSRLQNSVNPVMCEAISVKSIQAHGKMPERSFLQKCLSLGDEAWI